MVTHPYNKDMVKKHFSLTREESYLFGKLKERVSKHQKIKIHFAL
jgi:hypothetical protein